MIEWKLAAQRAGRRLGNRRHHPQDELSPAELRRPPDIIAHAVWLYFRFSLSFRDVEDLPVSSYGSP